MELLKLNSNMFFFHFRFLVRVAAAHRNRPGITGVWPCWHSQLRIPMRPGQTAYGVALWLVQCRAKSLQVVDTFVSVAAIGWLTQ